MVTNISIVHLCVMHIFMFATVTSKDCAEISVVLRDITCEPCRSVDTCSAMGRPIGKDSIISSLGS